MTGTLKCPLCVAGNQISRVYIGPSTTTLMTTMEYFDEQGTYHLHDPNTISREFSCSNGHRWQEQTVRSCPACGERPDRKARHA